MDSEGIRRSPYPDVKLPNKNVWEFLEPKFDEQRDKVALISRTTLRKITYGEYKIYALRLGHYIKNLRVDGKPICTIGIISPAVLEYPIFLMGCVASGVPFTTMSYDSTPDEISYQFNKSNVNLVIIDYSLKEVIEKAIPLIDHKVHILYNSLQAEREANVQSIIHGDRDESQLRAVKTSPDTVLCYFYTSGTTGKPKGTAHSHSNFTNFFVMYEEEDERNMASVYMTNLPICHIGGVAITQMNAIYTMSTLIIGTYTDVDVIIKDVEFFKITELFLHPHQMEKILESPVTNIDRVKSLKTIKCGGSKPKEKNAYRMLEITNNKVHVRWLYGMTEIFIGTKTPKEVNRFDSIGVLFPNVKAKVIDINTGHIIKDDSPGELHVKNPCGFLHYLKKPEETEAAKDKDGWIKTGDIVSFGNDGYVTYISRLKELIVCNAINVSPVELEEVLHLHPSIKDAGVFGIPDNIAGELAKAAIVVRENCEISEEEIHGFMKQKFVGIKQLHGGIQFVKQIPRNHLGKIERIQLKKLYG